MPMRKSEFLLNLSTAATRYFVGMEPASVPLPSGRSEERKVQMAKGHAIDLAIFIEDAVRFSDEANPVVRVIRWFGTREVTRSSPLEDMAMVEEAWEYFEKMTWQYVNLYSNGNGELTTDDGKESGNPRRFVVRARLVPFR